MTIQTHVLRGDPPATVLVCRPRCADRTAIRYGGDPAELGQLLEWISQVQGGISAHGHTVGTSVQISDAVGIEIQVLPGDYLVTDPTEPRGWRRCSDIEYNTYFETVGPARADFSWGQR